MTPEARVRLRFAPASNGFRQDFVGFLWPTVVPGTNYCAVTNRRMLLLERVPGQAAVPRYIPIELLTGDVDLYRAASTQDGRDVWYTRTRAAVLKPPSERMPDMRILLEDARRVKAWQLYRLPTNTLHTISRWFRTPGLFLLLPAGRNRPLEGDVLALPHTFGGISNAAIVSLDAWPPQIEAKALIGAAKRFGDQALKELVPYHKAVDPHGQPRKVRDVCTANPRAIRLPD